MQFPETKFLELFEASCYAWTLLKPFVVATFLMKLNFVWVENEALSKVRVQIDFAQLLHKTGCY